MVRLGGGCSTSSSSSSSSRSNRSRSSATVRAHRSIRARCCHCHRGLVLLRLCRCRRRRVLVRAQRRLWLRFRGLHAFLRKFPLQFLELPQKPGVRVDTRSAFFDVLETVLQIPLQLVHQVAKQDRGAAGFARETMDEHVASTGGMRRRRGRDHATGATGPGSTVVRTSLQHTPFLALTGR